MSKALFQSVQMRKPQASTFDLTHDVKMSGKMGKLMPCLAVEVLPGDSFTLGADALIRLAPILAPLMHRIDFTIHYFFSPNRIVWDNWEEFIVNKTNEAGDPYEMPYIDLDSTKVGWTAEHSRFVDYLGIAPPDSTLVDYQKEKVSALPFAHYYKIYDEYYRDQNLVDPYEWKLVDGNNSPEWISFEKVIPNRSYEHDYFTSCLPFAQKGAAVDIPLGVVELADDLTGKQPFFQDSTGGAMSGDVSQYPTPDMSILLSGGGSTPAFLNPNGSLEVQATTINDLRRAYRLQEWLEKNARGGSRYIEHIYSHWAVKSPDARLQRPEYITGVKAPIVISEVLNTTGPTDFYNGETGNLDQTGSPQGDMSGHGVGMHQGRLGKYYSYEHGWIIGIISIMPKTAYQQGINRMFTRFDFLDYAFPSFAQIGEQEVLKRELFAYQKGSEDLFGYIPRYAEYKFMNSRVAGDFRNTLDFWHLGRKFANMPELNQSFIECVPEDVLRIFAVQDETDNLWMHLLHKIRVKRKLPFFGTPTI